MKANNKSMDGDKNRGSFDQKDKREQRAGDDIKRSSGWKYKSTAKSWDQHRELFSLKNIFRIKREKQPMMWTATAWRNDFRSRLSNLARAPEQDKRDQKKLSARNTALTPAQTPGFYYKISEQAGSLCKREHHQTGSDGLEFLIR